MKKILGMYWNEEKEFVIPMQIRFLVSFLAIIVIAFISPIIAIIMFLLFFFGYAYLYYVNFIKKQSEGQDE